jgi:hypothetical protein
MGSGYFQRRVATSQPPLTRFHFQKNRRSGILYKRISSTISTCTPSSKAPHMLHSLPPSIKRSFPNGIRRPSYSSRPVTTPPSLRQQLISYHVVSSMTSISALYPTPRKACNTSPLNLLELILRPCLLLLTLSLWETVDTALLRRHSLVMSGAEET